MFICINNMILTVFNPKVLVQNWNLFWHNCEIKVNGCKITDPYMISNIYVPLFWSNLVCFGFYVVGFVRCSWCYLFIYLFFDPFCSSSFEFCFLMFNLIFLALVLFSSQTRISSLIIGRTKNLESTQIPNRVNNWLRQVKKIGSKVLIPCLVCHNFC